jgi:uncharacterized protein (DUF111 family)
MSKTLYLDCLSGISGDMTVGALLDLGVRPSTLEWELSKLGLGDFHLHTDRAKRQEIEGVLFSIHAGATHEEHGHEPHAHEHEEHGHHHHHGEAGHAHGHKHGEDCGGHHHHNHEEHAHEHGDECCGHHHEHEHRSHADIRAMIQNSELSPWVKTKSLAIFHRLAVAEGKIHGVSPEAVHFHEVGALDSIADIVLTCVGLEALKVEQVFASALFDGTGTIACAHGTFPLPAPATLEILRGIPLGQIDEPHELITPTGAAILAEFAQGFGPMPTLTIEKIGYGCGSRDLTSRPNVLRAVLGTLA